VVNAPKLLLELKEEKEEREKIYRFSYKFFFHPFFLLLPLYWNRGLDIGGNSAATSGMSIVTPGRDLFSSKRISYSFLVGLAHGRVTLELGITPR